MFDVVFALDRILDGLEFLEVNETLQFIPLGEAMDESRQILNAWRTRSFVTPT
jgi:hypothetical protein